MARTLYLFIDEAGNFDFSKNGTKYFCLTCVYGYRADFSINSILENYKYDIIEDFQYCKKQKYFHACEDNDYIRKKVFSIISDHSNFSIKSIIAGKYGALSENTDKYRFYLEVFEKLLTDVLSLQNTIVVNRIVIITDTIPIKAKREKSDKAIKTIIKRLMPKNTEFESMHHESMSHYGLQIADYCNWAIFNKWERGKLEYYEYIKDSVLSEKKF